MEANRYLRPATLEEAHQILLQNPKNILLGGGLWLKKTTAMADALVDLSALGLNQIRDLGNRLEIGAMVTLGDFELSPLVKDIQNGILVESASQIMGVAFRNSATIGGSIAGRFPFSDIITPLLALDTTLVFYPQKEMSLADFLNFRGRLSDILTHVIIKKTSGRSFFKKVKTTALDFAILNVAITRIDNKYRIAIGSRPSVASLAVKAMAILDDAKKLDCDVILKAAETSVDELLYATTTAASADYRRTLAKTYVKRGLEEVSR
ncbi:MAG: FAD binding domain-containing protein [Bacilli bacterium]|jgi:CO/xanthine dehydrogenase FAD-binding subunit